jgi:hypothetical protein
MGIKMQMRDKLVEAPEDMWAVALVHTAPQAAQFLIMGMLQVMPEATQAEVARQVEELLAQQKNRIVLASHADLKQLGNNGLSYGK